MIKAKIIADSVNANNNRIVSWILTYPRFIHAEFMTHRVFSRNAASSRAIPIEKMLKSVQDNPAMPEYWGANQKGMQAATELEGPAYHKAIYEWMYARDQAITAVQSLNEIGVHKQIANRITEPWMHITVLATATEYSNFFGLRAHKDAQPEFQVLAYTMLREYMLSKPNYLRDGQWHIPFGDRMPDGLSIPEKLKVATARAARVSYVTFDGEINVMKDIELHDRLAQSGHWSPFEHCAMAEVALRNSNFVGWQQYRKQFENEGGPKGTAPYEYVRQLLSMPKWVRDAIEKNDAITVDA